MSEAGALLRAVLGEYATTESEALLHLEAALMLEVDPLDYCVHRFGLGEALVMARAAAWAGLPFLPAVPLTGTERVVIGRIDRMSEVRVLRLPGADGAVLHAAPRFATFLRLKGVGDRRPSLRGRIVIVPGSAIRSALAELAREAMMESARHRLFRRWPHAAGHIDAPRHARIGFVLLLALLMGAVAGAPWLSASLFLPLVSLLLLLPALMRLAAALLPPPVRPTVAMLDDAELPVYTVLVPLRDEAHMVGQLAAALRAINYPPEKLDIRFVVETRSLATVAAVQRELYDPRFELVLVPDALPRTKPKALNYALPLVRGEHLVVYDAEDIPEPGQLRLAASTFAARPELTCLQAELVIDNAGEGLLPALFAGEYAGQFGLMLPLLARLGLPMPLGGTSNHFRVDALRAVGGWDPFNVTEDADLGVRLARRGMRTATIASHTGEEAPIRLAPWLRQRTRWMKGWMQTLIVHNRDWRALLRDLGWGGFLGVHIYIGSMLLSAPLHTAFLVSLAVAVATLHWPISLGWAEMLAIVVFVIGYLGPALLVVAGLGRLKRLDLLPAQALLPFYWVLHGVAMLLAAWELVMKPFAWAKTPHGETRMRRGVARQPGHAESRARPRSAVSISGVRPETRSARTRPEPAAMVQPRVPWPVLR
jgi:cellulose synthase/poly-beta-1,6-N-acetylglucosamine synthase-like glycosyltransferase